MSFPLTDPMRARWSEAGWKRLKEKALAVRLGSMNTVATPFTQTDTIRVVMLPGGNGEVIGFVKDAEGKPGSLTYGGFTFTKLPE